MADAYRDGKVHVRRAECETCVFRPGNLMRLRPGRLRGMVDEALAEDTAITCHETLYPEAYDGDGHQAVCRGFFDRHARDTMPLRAALMLDRLEEVD